jgi:hypothetical protein
LSKSRAAPEIRICGLRGDFFQSAFCFPHETGLRAKTSPRLLLSLAIISVFVASSAADLDRDGLKDSFEQELLHRFLPSFQVSRGECDGLPAEFNPGQVSPKAIARNGTIYGRVVPRERGFGKPAGSKATLAVQYFHLWTRDCGLFSHRLDVEHVTAVVEAKDLKQPARKWTALYWYAGAHEDTLCENSAAIRAIDLKADARGPKVWISKGKHASYLDLQRCARGCRTDDCSSAEPMRVRRIVNLGEPDHPLNGSLFIHSRRWRFLDKLNENLPGTS